MERSKNLFEIPGIFQTQFMQSNVRLRRNRLDICNHRLSERKLFRRVKQLKPCHQQILMLANRDGRPPSDPTIFPWLCSIEQSSQNSKHNNRAVG